MSDKALAIIPRGITEVMALAVELSKATTISAEFRNSPANTLAAIMAGAEIGFAPMASLRSVNIIKGVPKLSADAMVAAVLASGKAQYFEPSTYSHTSVTFVTKRAGSTREQSVTWSAEDAKRAGLVGDNHRLYPRQMLAARAKSELARLVYPDICAGIYTEEEIPSDDRPLASSSEPTPQPPANDEIQDGEIATVADRCAAASSMNDLKLIVPALNKLPKGSPERDAALAAYKAKAQEIELAAQLQASAEIAQTEAAAAP